MMPTGLQNLRVQIFVTILAVVLFAIKIIAWRMTHSVAIMTDALESTINVFSGFIGLYSLHLSNQPRDKNHPYGHGKAEFISAGIEGTMICLAGLSIVYQAVTNLFHPPQLTQLDKGIYLILLTAVLNFAAGYFAVRIGQKNNSIALIASGKHLETDTFSTLGIVIGLVLIRFTGWQWLDSASALLIGGFVIIISYKILRRSVDGMMDRADEDLIQEIVTFINEHRRENWIDIHNLRVIKYGAVLHVDMHITMPWYLNIREAHTEQEILVQFLRQKYGSQVELFAHIDPCQEFSCRICMKENCNVRQHPFEEKIAWTTENVMQNHKHRLEQLKIIK